MGFNRMEIREQLLKIDYSKLEEIAKAQYRGNAKSSAYDAYLWGASMNLGILDELEQKSALECKLDDIIDSLWSGKGGQIFGSYIDTVKKNPRTKDVYRSKSTTHSFPWYHKNRKY